MVSFLRWESKWVVGLPCMVLGDALARQLRFVVIGCTESQMFTVYICNMAVRLSLVRYTEYPLGGKLITCQQNAQCYRCTLGVPCCRLRFFF